MAVAVDVAVAVVVENEQTKEDQQLVTWAVQEDQMRLDMTETAELLEMAEENM